MDIPPGLIRDVPLLLDRPLARAHLSGNLFHSLVEVDALEFRKILRGLVHVGILWVKLAFVERVHLPVDFYLVGVALLVFIQVLRVHLTRERQVKLRLYAILPSYPIFLGILIERLVQLPRLLLARIYQQIVDLGGGDHLFPDLESWVARRFILVAEDSHGQILHLLVRDDVASVVFVLSATHTCEPFAPPHNADTPLGGTRISRLGPQNLRLTLIDQLDAGQTQT